MSALQRGGGMASEHEALRLQELRMQGTTASSSEHLSPQALEDKYTDVLSHFQNMMTSNAEVHDNAESENTQETEQRPVLQQLSPVSKFLHNIQLLESADCDPSESDVESHATALGQQFAEGAIHQDHTPTDTPKAKHSRPSPPKFTQDGAYSGLDGSRAQEHSIVHPPHIPRQLLQQLTAQQLRITELEKELAAEKQKSEAQSARIHAQQQAEEKLQKELNHQKAASAHASQQAATLRQDLVIAHAARSDADSRAAATASELTQLSSSLEESQANILQQSASASAAESDLQDQLQETSDLQKRLKEFETRAKAATEEANDLRKAVKEAMDVADAATVREEEALQQQRAATEREAAAAARQAEWKKAAEAAAVLAEASIAEANTAKAAAASAQVQLQVAATTATPVDASPGAGRSPGQGGVVCSATTPRSDRGKHKDSPSPNSHPARPSPGREFKDRDSAVRVLNKLQQRLWDHCGREGDGAHGSPGGVGEAGGSQQVKRKRSDRRGPRGGLAGVFNVVEALDDVLMHEKHLMKHQCEAAKAAECQEVEMMRLQQDYHRCMGHGEALTQRVSVMEAEAAVLRSAVADTEAARAIDAAQLATEYAAASRPAELRSTGMQAGLPASLVRHRTGLRGSPGGQHEDAGGRGAQILCMSAYTQTETEQPAKSEAAGTQTDDESLKDERLQMWEEMKQHRNDAAHRTGAESITDAWAGASEVYAEAASHGSHQIRHTHEYNSSMPQRVVNSGASNSFEDVHERAQWVHGRNGCAAFVGEPDAAGCSADVASTCAPHSPPVATQGLHASHTGRYEAPGGDRSSGPVARTEVQMPQQTAPDVSRDSVYRSVDTERQNGQFSRDQRISAAEGHLQYENDGKEFEFRASSGMPQHRSTGSHSRPQSVSVPPTPRTEHSQSARHIREQSTEYGSGECNAAIGGVKWTGEAAGGSSCGPTCCDRSVPSRRHHQVVPEHSAHARQEKHHHLEGDDAHRWSWDAATAEASTRGRKAANPTDAPSQGRRSRRQSQSRALSDNSAHTYAPESYPPAFAPGPSKHDFEQGAVDSLALTLVPSVNTGDPPQHTYPSHYTSDTAAQFTSDFTAHSQLQRRSYGWQHDAAQRASANDHNRSYSIEHPQTSSSDPAFPSAPEAGEDGSEYAGGGAGASAHTHGFDDGLRDLVARLDEIQRKQAAALAQLSDSNTPDAQAGGLGSNNRQRALSPDIHSAGGWASGQVGYAYGDGIPTPETVLGVDISPEPLSLPMHMPHASRLQSPAPHGNHAPAMAHRQSYASPNHDWMPSNSLHGDVQSFYRTVSAEHLDNFDHPSSRTNTSAAAAQRLSRPGLGPQRSRRDSGRNGSSHTARGAAASHPLHRSADSVTPEYIAGMHRSHQSMQRHSPPPGASNHRTETSPSHTQVHQRSAPTGYESSQPHRDSHESFESSSRRERASYSSSATPAQTNAFEFSPQDGSRGSYPSALPAATGAAAWRSRVHMRHKVGQVEPQERVPAGTTASAPVVMRAQSPSPSLSRSASILDAAAKQCSGIYASAQVRQSAIASMTDAMSAYSSSAFATAHATSAPSSPTRPTRSSLGTPNLRPFGSAGERRSAQHGQQAHAGNASGVPSGPSRTTPWHRSSGGPVHISTGDSFSGPGIRQPLRVPRTIESLRCSGPPQYGALSSATSRTSAGPLPYPAIRPQHGALKPCTSRAEKIAQEQLGAEISRRGGRQGGVLRQSGTSGVSQASSSHVALSERTWSRLRRELGGGSTRTELSSESGSV